MNWLTDLLKPKIKHTDTSSIDVIPKVEPKLTSSLVGREFKCGRFFWIENCIGFEDNAQHGHRSSGFDRDNPGSADENCWVTVLKVFEDKNMAAVALRRPELPYGALAAIGTIFMVPLNMLTNVWPQERETIKNVNDLRDAVLKLVKG